MAKYFRRSNVALMLLIVLSLVLTLVGTQGSSKVNAQGTQFGDPNFQITWNRTDLPVAQGVVSRAWYWGPLSAQPRILFEQYVDAPNGSGQRLVQYFDKSRMEINNPSGDRSNPFFVTNGLLTVELITGRLQLGNNTFEQRTPATIDIASDVDDANAPTYATFSGLIGISAGDRTGQYATQTIDRQAQIGNDPSKASVAGTQFVHYEPATQHNIPAAMWDFLNESGPVYVNGSFVQQRINDPWFYASGYPIAEPFWAHVKIAGHPTDVLIQPYQRRVLTYVPTNPAGFKVEVGNIGQHYYDWRYGGNPPTPGATNTPAPVTTVTATPVAQPSPTPKPITGKIVYTSDMSDTHFTQIYSIKANGGSVVNLTHDQSNNRDAAWSPDGTKIAFVSDRNTGPYHIYVMNADGSNPVELNPNFPSKQFRPRWSPDGTHIVFQGVDDAFPDGEIFVTEAVAGVDPVRLTENNSIDTDPDYSPDGSKIVFSSNRDGTQSLYVMNSDGSNPARITNGTNGTADVEPRWSPQGNLIVYRSGDPANADIYTVKTDGSGKQKIVNNATNDWDPGFDSTGSRLVFMRQLGKQQLYIMHTDGADVQPIPSQSTTVNNSQPDWFDK